MHTFLKALVSLSVLICMVSCSRTSNLESRGNSAYWKAQKAGGDTKRTLEKEAYVYFLRAIQAAPNKAQINNNLRNRFIETTLNRGMFILNESHADMDALQLFIRDIDGVMSQEVVTDLKQQYALFLMRLADSTYSRGKLWQSIVMFDKAAGVAPNPSGIAEKKATIVKNYVNNNIEIGKMSFEESKAQKDPKAMILAEYYAKLALVFDPNNAEAKDLLSNARKANINVYSAFEAVVQDKPDSNIYDKVNDLDVLMALPVRDISGSGVRLKVNLYNYSYNPLRLWPKSFSLVDVNGNKYSALPSSTTEPEILDQQFETTKLVLLFPRPSAEIKKLIYEYEDHYSEKNFF